MRQWHFFYLYFFWGDGGVWRVWWVGELILISKWLEGIAYIQKLISGLGKHLQSSGLPRQLAGICKNKLVRRGSEAAHSFNGVACFMSKTKSRQLPPPQWPQNLETEKSRWVTFKMDLPGSPPAALRAAGGESANESACDKES